MTQRILLVVSLMLASTSPAWALPRITPLAETVEITEVTPGASVVLYAILHESTGWSTRISELADVLADTDSDGTVLFELGRAVPTVSLWLAVDLSTGETAASSPEGFTSQELPFPPSILRVGLEDRLNRFEMSGGITHALVARSGADPAAQGAWILLLGDGGDQDDDGSYDGKMGFLLAQMRPVAASPLPPEEITVGDVVALIHPDTLDFVVATFAATEGN